MTLSCLNDIVHYHILINYSKCHGHVKGIVSSFNSIPFECSPSIIPIGITILFEYLEYSYFKGFIISNDMFPLNLASGIRIIDIN